MTGDSVYLGIDLGTSGLKLSLVDQAGQSCAEAEGPYEVHTSAPGHAETDPADWLTALHRAGSRLSGRAACPVAALGVTEQMHGVVLSDRDGQPLRPALLWADQRAGNVMRRWTDLPAVARSWLSNPLVPGMAGPLLTWLHEHDAASLDGAALVTSPKDWLRGRLTRDTTTERSDASATLLWDVVADDWSTTAQSLTGVSSDQLPALAPSQAVVGSSNLFEQQRAHAPVVAGAADTAAALLALQATQPPDTWSRSLVINAGTGIQIVRPQAPAEARTDPLTHLYADADGGWYAMLAVQNGGMALSWVQSALGVTWDQFLTREGVPCWSPSRGVRAVPDRRRGGLAPFGSTAHWSSLTPSTGRGQLARSAFEAFAFTIRRGIDMLGGHQGPVLLSGGGEREPWIRQLIADVLDLPVSFLHLRSASAMGAAVLAARGVGMQLPVPATVVKVKPSGQNRQPLDQAYQRWQGTVNA